MCWASELAFASVSLAKLSPLRGQLPAAVLVGAKAKLCWASGLLSQLRPNSPEDLVLRDRACLVRNAGFAEANCLLL